MTLFKSNSLVSADLFKKLMDMNKTLAGGTGNTSRRISIKGGRFREMVNGEQVRVNSSGSLNVVILSTSKIGRTYFEGTYDPENPSAPTCWSPDSEKPDAAVPAAQRKANACRDCPMNIKGSGQGEGRACRFSVRLAVAIEGQYDKVYQMQLPATSLFGEAKDNRFPMQAYAKFMTANETPIIAVVTQMIFDENSETPKLFFRPLRSLEEDELQEVLKLAEHDDVQKAITLTVYQQDKGDEASAGSKSYNPRKDKIVVEDAPATKPKAAAKETKAAPEDNGQLEMKFDAPVEEPKRVEAKASSRADAPEELGSVLSAWDD
jgi:hypothetical protein